MSLQKIGKFIYSVFAYIFYMAKSHKKIFLCSLSAVVALVILLTCLPNKNNKKEAIVPKKEKVSISKPKEKTELKPVEEPIVEPEPEPVVEEPKKAEEPKPVTPTAPVTQQYINVVPGGKSNTDIEDNDFLDALVYCGYNLQTHRNSGKMWQYVLCKDKPALGWLSKITYGGGCSGYETTADGKPNIARFEQGGLVCASYATYVYFNYLPNVVGVDVSALDKPERSYDANSWYIAGQKWVEKGYSRYIDFTARESGTRTVFTPNEPIPIGSLMLLTDFKNRNNHCTHICLYAGYKNGYHWVTHVGNENGPEFCAMERMSCGPDPQWPLKVITTPNGLVK